MSQMSLLRSFVYLELSDYKYASPDGLAYNFAAIN